MNFYRVILLSVMLVLAGCTASLNGGPGGARAGYAGEARSAMKDCEEWIHEPKNAALLKAATRQCESTLVKYANSDSAKSGSYRTLGQLKTALETGQGMLSAGEDPSKVSPDTGICPVYSVRQVVAMLESDLSAEEHLLNSTPAPTP